MNSNVQIAPKSLGLKLDLGSGNTPRHGFEGVDLFAPNAKWKQNLLEFPWPWGDEQVSEINCSHFIEHVPMVYITSNDEVDHITQIPVDEKSQDLLLRFFDECYRVLQPGGKLHLQWPSNRSDRAFQDPTHRRFIPPMFVGYLNREWREATGLGHYLCKCNFTDGSKKMAVVNPIGVNPDFQYYSAEASGRRIAESWNTFLDWQAVLVKE